jgi:predicted dehydrogenase
MWTAERVASSKLRVGIAGLGFGAGVHLPVFRARPDVEVRALLGRDAAKVRATAARFDVPIACTSPAEFAALDLDAVVIALPPQPAGDVARLALARGWAVLAEKPIAATAAEAQQLAAQAHGMTTMVDFEFRELASFRMLKDTLASGRFGRVRCVAISWRSLSYAQRNREWSWKTDATRGGGVVTLSGLHLFDLLEWLFGPVAVEEASWSNSVTRGFTPAGEWAAADTVDMVLRSADGVPIEAHLSNSAHDDLGHRWTIETEEGRLILYDEGVGTFGAFSLSHGRDVLTADPAREGDYRLGPVGSLAERFIFSTRAGCTAAPNFSDAARAQIMMEQIATPAKRPSREATIDPRP